ncbi:MAG: threonine/serine exporter family protein [Bacteroidales bacterium]|jgi:uncharacterized membrane protein YjjP (DUF1212 family)|nr:threonine/serine exporter family protein [Bacteroidales bacterium]
MAKGEISINNNNLKSRAAFLSEYAAMLMGSGVHSSRVIRNTKRMGEAMSMEVIISNFHKSLMLYASDRSSGESVNILKEIPSLPISFEINTNLSRLSWEAYDGKLSFDELKERYRKLVARPKLHPVVILILSSFANASFCALFGGTWYSMGIVFSATMIGMSSKQKLLSKGVNVFIVFALCSFIASIVASTAVIFKLQTSDIAMATSVLYLIPGVPLINGFMDMMEGHVILGMARLIDAFLLVLCIAIGLSGTMMLLRNSLLL